MRRLREFISDEKGATVIEYCFIAGMISVLIVAGATATGVNLQTKFLGPLANGFP
jgi:Flp pilus assembly pilin Flp